MRDTRVFSPFVDAYELRAQFPVLGRVAFLNAGTDGPLPARAVRAAGEELERAALDGRALSHFERRFACLAHLDGDVAFRLAQQAVANDPALHP